MGTVSGMSTATKAAAVRAVIEGTDSAVVAYGWKPRDAYYQAVRETAGEFGVSEQEIKSLMGKGWG